VVRDMPTLTKALGKQRKRKASATQNPFRTFHEHRTIETEHGKQRTHRQVGANGCSIFPGRFWHNSLGPSDQRVRMPSGCTPPPPRSGAGGGGLSGRDGANGLEEAPGGALPLAPLRVRNVHVDGVLQLGAGPAEPQELLLWGVRELQPQQHQWRQAPAPDGVVNSPLEEKKVNPPWDDAKLTAK